MTTKGIAKHAPQAPVLSNGNADFWSIHPSADLIGGEVTETENGIIIAGGQVYRLENLSLDTVNIEIEKMSDEMGDFYSVVIVEIDTNEEIFIDDSATSLTEAFDSLNDFAPVPSFLDAWNAHDLAIYGDPAEYFNNCMVITNFEWIDATRDIRNVGQLAIYAHRGNPDAEAPVGPDVYFSVYHTSPGHLNCLDMQFTDFYDLLETVTKYSKLHEDLSADRY